MVIESDKYWSKVIGEWQNGHPYNSWRRHSDAVNFGLIKRWLPKPKIGSILKTDLFDEAVSPGLCRVLSHYTTQITGIDISPDVVKAAKAQNDYLSAHVADVRELNIEDACFDVVVSISTLDHFNTLEEIQMALNELSRVLKPGGVLILTLDNPGNPMVWLRNTLPSNLLLATGLIPYETGTTCKLNKLRSMCRSASLQELETTALLHCPRVVAVAASRAIDSTLSSRTMQSAYLNFLSKFEILERLPTKYISGYFTAILLRKPELQGLA